MQSFQLLDVQKQNEKQNAAAETPPVVVADEEEAPPQTNGSQASAPDIILPGAGYYDPDPFLMPKFGLVAEFATDYAEMN